MSVSHEPQLNYDEATVNACIADLDRLATRPAQDVAPATLDVFADTLERAAVTGGDEARDAVAVVAVLARGIARSLRERVR